MEWRSVVGYEKLYEVSDKGQVHSKKTGKYLKPYQGQVYLRKDGQTNTVWIFDLVAAAFGYDVNDIYPRDGDKSNFNLSNVGVVSEFKPISDDAEWRYIPGYEGFYQASVHGEIRSVDRVVREKRTTKFRKGTTIQPSIGKDGYYHVLLSVLQEQKLCSVHRLVASAFIANPDDKPQVNHIDGNRLNNDVSNLEWVTQSENMQHARDNGLWSPLECGEISKRITGVPVRCITTGECYRSLLEAGRATGMDKESVKESAELHRLRKGLQFEYAEEGE